MLEDIGIDVQGWADDIVIGFPIVNLKNIESNFQHVLQVLEKIFSWGKDFKALFNASKTKMVLFHKPYSKFDLKYFSLMTSEGLIKLSSSAILLGVVLDSHFSWTQHIEHIVSKIKRITFGLIAFVKKHWYVDSKLLKILYNSVIEPIMLYSGLAWIQVSKNKSLIYRIQSCQKLMGILISGCYKTASTQVILGLSGITPASILLKFNAVKRIHAFKRLPFFDWSLPLSIPVSHVVVQSNLFFRCKSTN